jgi:CDGSH-type Zn-finger protein
MPAEIRVELIECPNGPLLVRGATSVRDPAGDQHLVTRSVVALCRCARSSRAPWCDGTHKLLKPAAAAARVAGYEVETTGRAVTIESPPPTRGAGC